MTGNNDAAANAFALAGVEGVANAAPHLVEAFLSGRNAQTRKAYQSDLADFAAFWGETDGVNAARRLLSGGQGNANALVFAYRASLVSRGLQAATVNRRLAALRSLVKLARMFGLVTWSLDVANAASEPYRDTRGPGVANVTRLLAAASEDTTALGLRNRAALRLLFDLGLRRGEVVALDVDDVDLAEKTVRVTGKRRTQKETLTLPAPTCAALRVWLRERGDAPGPLFINFDHANKGATSRLTGTSLYRIVRDLGDAIGVRARPHGLRHTAITEACKAAQNAGLGLEEAMDFSRHKSVAVLMIYRDRERNVQGQLASLVAETAKD